MIIDISKECKMLDGKNLKGVCKAKGENKERDEPMAMAIDSLTEGSGKRERGEGESKGEVG